MRDLRTCRKRACSLIGSTTTATFLRCPSLPLHRCSSGVLQPPSPTAIAAAASRVISGQDAMRSGVVPLRRRPIRRTSASGRRRPGRSRIRVWCWRSAAVTVPRRARHPADGTAPASAAQIRKAGFASLTMPRKHRPELLSQVVLLHAFT